MPEACREASPEGSVRARARVHPWHRRATAAGLAVIGVIGLVNSWGALYGAAERHMTGTGLPLWVAAGSLPLLLDVLIVVASARYVIGVLEQRPVGGWRVTAHAAIAGTVVLNALAAQRPGDIPWHVIAPAVLSVVVELVAREILGELREAGHAGADRIPLRLWLSAPGESVRTAWRMARTGERSASAARISADTCAAARDVLERTLPGRVHSRVRRQVTRRLWAGTIPPGDVFAACGWTDAAASECTPDRVLRVALGSLTGAVPGERRRRLGAAHPRPSAPAATRPDAPRRVHPERSPDLIGGTPGAPAPAGAHPDDAPAEIGGALDGGTRARLALVDESTPTAPGPRTDEELVAQVRALDGPLSARRVARECRVSQARAARVLALADELGTGTDGAGQ